ncbi:ribbon-helix-helix protein, CopG family [Actinoplanes sp. NPDC051861]|uniref:type II toxin-antitoxin system VapB family antitoxin n=1 Tax=Actinoplanes sp. NPDC051861 TaxID=3155170 RepID=UPI00344112F2
MDLLIRDVPEEVVAALDAEARRLGLSRSEYLRRRLAQAFPRESREVTVADLARFETDFPGLADEDLMDEAWR